jgi:putative type II/III system pilus formation protein
MTGAAPQTPSIKAGTALTPLLRPMTWIAALVAALTLRPAHAETLNVFLDLASVVLIPDHTWTIVVGNPLIADGSVEAGGALVLTGKGYGSTTLTLLDRAGTALAEYEVRVDAPPGSVVIQRGTARETFNCEPHCERRITLGDGPAYFDVTLGQTAARNARSAQQPQPPQPQPQQTPPKGGGSSQL